MRAAIRYARSGPAKYIAHLDMQRAIGRAIRRARIPACYSHGFNPHLQMSFASPLSVGYETRSDYLEVEVEDGADCVRIEEALRSAFPPNMKVRDVLEIAPGVGKLMARNHSAAYRVRFDLESNEQSDTLKNVCERLMECPSYEAVDRKGRSRDIIPLIYELFSENDAVYMRLANASDRSLNPAVVSDVLAKEAGIVPSYSVCREECYAKDGDKAVPFIELLRDGPRQK